MSYKKYGGFGRLIIFLLKISGKFRGKNLMFKKFGGPNFIFFEKYRKIEG